MSFSGPDRRRMGRKLGAAMRRVAWCAGFASITLPVIADSGLVARPLAPHAATPPVTLFASVPPAASGIATRNDYADPRMWAERYHEFEVGPLGSGVAIADYDGDGRPDVFIVSKTEPCRLFRNLGGWKFEDATEKAGLPRAAGWTAPSGQPDEWKQGACFADVNNDGHLDLYVCRFAAPNWLFINQGDGTFREEAAARGLAVTDSSVMGSFADYDRDGWLDVYVQTNVLDSAKSPDGEPDYLFRNNRDGTFTNVTQRAGIRGPGQGHSATWWDYDGDGWPDLYVANDFAEPDQLYRNNRDGTFTNVINQVVPHQPFSSMGSDTGDVDNDGRLDFFVADMAASTPEKDLRSMADHRARTGEFAADGSAPQYLRNALYLNLGAAAMPEVAALAGLAATDWTWSVRFEDLDNDGRVDLFCTTGMHRESHNADLILKAMTSDSAIERIRVYKNSPVFKEPNLAFRNLGDLRFASTGPAWGLAEDGVSLGAAFGDLDGDGDLDLVYTNYQQGASVLRNDSPSGHRLVVALRGTRSNRFGVGATVRIETAAGPQVRQLFPARGYVSSSEPVLHFGLGDDTIIRRLRVSWPSGHEQEFTDVAADQFLTITEPDAPASPAVPPVAPATQFTEVAATVGLAAKVEEIPLDELVAQPLLPFRQNRRGPALAVGDLQGRGADDVVLGGTPRSPARVLLATESGAYAATDAANLARPGPVSDGPALLFDVDGDDTTDLLLTRGGVALPANSPDYQPQLLLNPNRSGLRVAEGALPALALSVGAAIAADFDRDGRLDVFLGGRTLPGRYPLPARSVLLRNDGGRFRDVTDELAPGLGQAGLVSSALWTDVDQDGWPDLLLALEWDTIRYWRNRGGQGFEDRSEAAGFAAAGNGWWTALASADFNGDGRLDYVAGNVGLNTPYHASPSEPAVLYRGDFKGTGGSQLVEARYDRGRLVPLRPRRQLVTQIPTVARRAPTTDGYARTPLEELLGADKLAAARKFTATEFRSGVFLSQPDGTFKFSPLPRRVQDAPFQGLAAGDFDGDANADIVAVQNSFAPIPAVGRFDSGIGHYLTGDGRGGWTWRNPADTGLLVRGDAKALAVLDLGADGRPDFLVSRNQDTTLAFRNSATSGRRSFGIRLAGPRGNPTGVGARITVTLADGRNQTAEVQAGSGYFTQSTATCFFGFPDSNPARTATVRWPDGTTTTMPIPATVTVMTIAHP